MSPDDIIDLCSKFYENTKKGLGSGVDHFFIVNSSSSSSSHAVDFISDKMLNSLILYEKSRSLKCNISASCGPILMNKTSFFSYGCVESDKKILGTVGAKGGKSKTSCIYGSEVYDKKFFFESFEKTCVTAPCTNVGP